MTSALNKALYVAVIDHARVWIGADGFRLKMVEENQGRFDGPILRRIARDYSVGRGIHASENGADGAADGLARLANNLADRWPNGLYDRAEACAELAKKAEGKYTHGFQASLMTKLMWFLKPKDWTVFDQFAAKGVGIPNGGDSIARMLDYYRELDERGFVGFTRAIQKVVCKSEYPFLHATRIIDNALMRIGGRGEDNAYFASRPEHFLTVLPKSAASSLKALAEQLGKEFARNNFIPT